VDGTLEVDGFKVGILVIKKEGRIEVGNGDDGIVSFIIDGEELVVDGRNEDETEELGRLEVDIGFDDVPVGMKEGFDD